VSRRRPRQREAKPVTRRRPGERAADGGRQPDPRKGGTGSRRAPDARPGGFASTLGGQLVILAVVFALAVLVAELAGAANLGVAFGVGQIAFTLALVYLLLKR
jgi:hypothetical protein